MTSNEILKNPWILYAQRIILFLVDVITFNNNHIFPIIQRFTTSQMLLAH